ncbi:hypothetical protein SAMN06265340_10331 [Desulfurobacterium atlanticum]|uniref:Uncharacterized protein n=2 Tax=Desulfurobacterium atlanticum TaxID=240169 RepID=A0A238YD66_9BACT|nr:hypothetical protein SAMN06265340_10331 [Desulfurobacterium atlanticum]
MQENLMASKILEKLEEFSVRLDRIESELSKFRSEKVASKRDSESKSSEQLDKTSSSALLKESDKGSFKEVLQKVARKHNLSTEVVEDIEREIVPRIEKIIREQLSEILSDPDKVKEFIFQQIHEEIDRVLKQMEKDREKIIEEVIDARNVTVEGLDEIIRGLNVLGKRQDHIYTAIIDEARETRDKVDYNSKLLDGIDTRLRGIEYEFELKSRGY